MNISKEYHSNEWFLKIKNLCANSIVFYSKYRKKYFYLSFSRRVPILINIFWLKHYNWEMLKI